MLTRICELGRSSPALHKAIMLDHFCPSPWPQFCLRNVLSSPGVMMAADKSRHLHLTSQLCAGFDDSHKIFREAMPGGFPWEVTEVYSGCAACEAPLHADHALVSASLHPPLGA